MIVVFNAHSHFKLEFITIWLNERKYIYVSTLLGGDEMLLHVLYSAFLGRLTISDILVYDDVSVISHITRPSLSTLDECHIPRVVSLVTSENLVL